MGELTGVNRSDLRIAAGQQLSYGINPALWDTEQAAAIDFCVDQGYRQFLRPPVIPNDEIFKVPYEWSFLRASHFFGAIAGQWNYGSQTQGNLPADFSGIISSAVIASAGKEFHKLAVISEDQFYHARTAVDETASGDMGKPRYIAVRQIETIPGGEGQNWDILLLPTPDLEYTIRFTYSMNPALMTLDTDHPRGGHQHAATILQSVVAACEYYIDEARGVHWQLFLDLLRSSIQMDMRQGRSEIEVWPTLHSDEREDGDITYDTLIRVAARELWGKWDRRSLSEPEFKEADFCVNRGYHKMLNPPPVDAAEEGWEWDWTRPKQEFQLTAFQHIYQLPTEFESIIDDYTYVPDLSHLPGG